VFHQKPAEHLGLPGPPKLDLYIPRPRNAAMDMKLNLTDVVREIESTKRISGLKDEPLQNIIY
jgi:hypothetical protein